MKKILFLLFLVQTALAGPTIHKQPVQLYDSTGAAITALNPLPITGGVGGGGGNAAAGLTGAIVPTSAGYTGFNLSGNLVGVSASNPFPIFFPTTPTFNLGILNGAATDATLTGGTGKFKLWDGTNALSINASGQLGISNFPSSFTANIGTTGGLALDGTLTGGTAKSVVRGGAKGSTAAADVTSTATDANHQALDVNVNAGTTTVTQATGTNLHTVVDSGTATVTQGTAANLNATVVQGTAAATAGAWPHKVTDGTNVQAVKAASTAAAAADPAAVVALSPNSPVPAGSNLIGGVNTAQVNGATVVTAAAGVQKVGIVGGTGNAMDSADNAAAPAAAQMTSGLYSTTVPALTSGNAAFIRLDSTGAPYNNFEGRKASYSVAMVDFAPISSATAPSVSITGSATKTVKLVRVGLSATAATGGLSTVNLRRFSALSGGTAASQSANIAKNDSLAGTATAVVNTWSVAATTATSAGILRALSFELPTPAVTVQPVQYEWTFGDKNEQAATLRGVSEFLGLCFNGIGTTPKAEIYIEWTEE